MGVRDYERNAGGHPRRRLHGARTPALALAAALAAAALATAAHAQLGGGQGLDLYSQLEVGPKTGVDTDQTPNPKDGGEIWEQVAGARFGWDESAGPERRGVVRGSATSFHTDLYAVAFRNTGFGAAGGSERIDCDSDGKPDTAVPVIYRYDDVTENVEPGWAEIPKQEIASDCDNSGYVGAIGWIGDGRALAVGGTGTYPRREPAYREECQQWEVLEEAPGVKTGQRRRLVGPYGSKCDPAGEGRAWLYESGRWRELDLSEQREQGMRGMTALGVDPNSASLSAPHYEYGLAGALGQLWVWRRDGEQPGRFAKLVTDGRSGGQTVAGGGFATFLTGINVVGPSSRKQIQFRVRDVSFMPGFKLGQSRRAYAVTAGCCAEDPLRNNPRLVVNTGADDWAVAELAESAPIAVLDHPIADKGHTRVNPRQDVPDSLYSLTTAKPYGAGDRVSVIATPGGPENPDLERPSIVSQPYCLDIWGSGAPGEQEDAIGAILGVPYSAHATGLSDPLFEAFRAQLSSARLVAGDGDEASSAGVDVRRHPIGGDLTQAVNPQNYQGVSFRPSGAKRPSTTNCGPWNVGGSDDRFPDGVPDWTVGELRSTRIEGLGARGLAFATAINTRFAPELVNHHYAFDEQGGFSPPSPDLARAGKDPANADRAFEDLTSKEKLAAYATSAYFLLPSYSLNAIDVIGGAGVGWTVGDHGAILRLGHGAAQAEQIDKPPPKLSRRGSEPIPERSSYELHRPAVPEGETGPLPAFGSGGRERVQGGRLVEWGSPDASTDPNNKPPDELTQVALGRSGSEGWAIGAGSESLYRLEGGRWSRCDPLGVPGQLEPDPDCAELAPLRRYRRLYFQATEPIGAPAGLLGIARVPSSDDELELIATAGLYRAKPEQPELPAVLRFSEGRWRLADDTELAAKELSGLLTVVNPLGRNPHINPHQIAFASPTDGWLLDRPSDPVQYADYGAALLHFDGEHWRRACTHAGRKTCEAETGALAGIDLKRSRLVAADGRVYLAGVRRIESRDYPVILYHERGEGETWRADPEGGGYDPAADGAAIEDRGAVTELAIARRPDGRLEGWALGRFGEGEGRTTLLRLKPGGRFERFREPALDDPSAAVVLAGEGPASPAFVAQHNLIYRFDPERERFAPLRAQPQGTDPNQFVRTIGVEALMPDGAGGFWAAVSGASHARSIYFLRWSERPPTPVLEEARTPLQSAQESFTALTGLPDGTLYATGETDTLYRYDRLTGWDRARIPGWVPPRATVKPPALAVAATPAGEGLVVGADGRIAGFGRGQVSLDRATGTLCGATPVPPCGTGRDLSAAAVAPDGEALAGGERMALLWRPAGGEFRAVDPPAGAAPGAAIAGISMPAAGRAWLATNTGLVFAGTRQGGAWSWELENRTRQGAVVPLDERGRQIPLRAIALDASGHGYAVGDRGVVLERSGDPGEPWRRLSLGLRDDLTAVALAANGPGALIGGRNGVVLSGAGGRFWVARPASYFQGPRSQWTGPVAGLALLPGVRPGQVEAWAATRTTDGALERETFRDPTLPNIRLKPAGANLSRLFHYASDPAEPLLSPERRLPGAVPDSPAPRPGELSLAALGNSAGAWDGTGITSYEALMDRLVGELAERGGGPGGPELAIFTGDAIEHPRANLTLSEASAEHLRWRDALVAPLTEAGLPLYAALGVRDLAQLPSDCPKVRDPIAGGDQVFGGDFACTNVVNHAAAEARHIAKTGENFAWRKAMADRPRPWGGGAPPQRGELHFRPVGDGPFAVRERDTEVTAPTVEPPARETEDELDRQVEQLRICPDLANVVCASIEAICAGAVIVGVCVPTGVKEAKDNARAFRDSTLAGTGGTLAKLSPGGAATHYAFDLIDSSQGEEGEIARLIFVDNSSRSLAASDPFQQPLEAKGGQASWLEEMLCIRGQSAQALGRCTRKPHQAAIVVASTPTYSYGPTHNDELATDSTAFEAILMRHRASLVVSGRLGWNGRYWATAPGVHEPCPGGDYQETAPEPGGRACGRETPALSPPPPAAGLSGALSSLAPPPPPAVSEATGGLASEGLLPFVVASGAGGPFGALGSDASASGGFWHGYTVARLDRSGDPRTLIVEQRPILDWVQVHAASHVLRPGQRMRVRGVGRVPPGLSLFDPETRTSSPQYRMSARFVRIENAAVTHRYDLVEADPARPWLPRQDADGRYVPLDPSIATVDSQTGTVRVGRGNHPRAYALAILSVGDHVASWPIAFESRRSFRPKPPASLPPLPLPKVAASAAAAIQSPQAPPPVNPPSPQVDIPPPPTIPPLPTPSANPPQPPAPPAPPPPPVSPQATPLDLVTSPLGLNVAPQATVIPPPAPPIQPAPPGGARREARQRQAATQKSGAEMGEGSHQADQASDATGGLAEQPPGPYGTAMVRRELPRADGGSVVAVARREQPSAWARGALYGGGLSLAALALAAGYLTLRPRPRKRTPDLPAPARAQARWRR